MARQKVTVYMLTTADKYELPVAVADSIFELARLTGSTFETISKAIDRSCHGVSSKWKAVTIYE